MDMILTPSYCHGYTPPPTLRFMKLNISCLDYTFKIVSSIRSLATIYLQKHAVRKRDAALATDTDTGSNRLKSGVKGRGKYRTWTAPALLKSAFITCTLGSAFSIWLCQFDIQLLIWFVVFSTLYVQLLIIVMMATFSPKNMG